MPDWLKILLSAIVTGIFSIFVFDQVRRKLDGARRRSEIKLLLYGELARLLLLLMGLLETLREDLPRADNEEQARYFQESRERNLARELKSGIFTSIYGSIGLKDGPSLLPPVEFNAIGEIMNRAKSLRDTDSGPKASCNAAINLWDDCLTFVETEALDRKTLNRAIETERGRFAGQYIREAIAALHDHRDQAEPPSVRAAKR